MGMTIDVSIALGYFSFVYTIEYAFLGMVLVMAYTLSSEIIERGIIHKKLWNSEKKHKEMIANISDVIAIMGSDGIIRYKSPNIEKWFGWQPEDLIGTDGWATVHPDDLERIQNEFITLLKTDNASKEVEYQYKCKDGSYKWIQLAATNLTNYPIINGVLMNYCDITERIQAEEQTKASLKEKQTLLDEIHHRVKNNMNVVSSLLKLQADNIEDDKIKQILKTSQSRVYAMSAVHETLHGLENLSEIDLKTYLSKITTAIFQTYSTDHQEIKLKSNVEEVPISLNQAYPLGLTINELISNSLKYAFPYNRKGEITVSMKKLNTELELTIMDDGVGIPDSFDWKNSKSLGLKLVRTLVENQLDGSIEMESNNGTKFTIKFKIDNT